ncbi:hypothetical protein [Aquiflexum gelatinilyticum]|uniref:YceI family protein n=1 Tax=Aquiflexum gelatinilyticum TaxID=2961943 RepID=A0A9X2P6X3_9BACT|nr:hypothetical protein [Aquiflexum gelatinilyticum]MCR9014820.1 hypothetical protein [Aquiflexum gelatinilyticum]MCS4434530.1 hypothetical protein [Aquiflexum gelatinilyticum]
MMRILLALILILLNPETKEREVIVTRKMITVSGQTSIGGFSCDYSKVGLKDTLFIDFEGTPKEMVFDIPVRDFSCGNFLINRDFRNTIKSDKFPSARVKVQNLKSNYGHYTCDLSVTLVGKKLDFSSLVLKRVPEGLHANLILSFEELNLEAPKKMGGLVKVEEKLTLDFTLGF